MKNFIYAAAFCALAAYAGSAYAQDAATGPSRLNLSVGIYDFWDNDDTATDFRVEYAHSVPLFWKIHPWAGVEATTDGSVWGGGGILADFKLADNIYITPSFGVGLYAKGSSDKDLDYPIEFRSQLEGGYEFINGHRFGVSFSHMSNAGLGDSNPGAESLNVNYHIPVGNLF